MEFKIWLEQQSSVHIFLDLDETLVKTFYEERRAELDAFVADTEEKVRQNPDRPLLKKFLVSGKQKQEALRNTPMIDLIDHRRIVVPRPGLL